MVNERGSATALSCVGLRAMESEKPEGERLLYDPYARQLAGPAGMKFAQDAVEISPRIIHRVALRTRVIDDHVKECVIGGVQQVVILGAGYDSRAYRLEELKGIRVFEVDHPATGVLKREKVEEVFGEIPKNTSLIPLDLLADTQEELGRKLEENGYDPAKKTLFILEGLLSYLDGSAIDRLLGFMATCAGRESSVIINHGDPDRGGPGSEKIGEKNIKGGEPRLSNISVGKLVEFLEEHGFSQINRRSAHEIIEQRYPEMADVDIDTCFVTAVVKG